MVPAGIRIEYARDRCGNGCTFGWMFGNELIWLVFVCWDVDVSCCWDVVVWLITSNSYSIVMLTIISNTCFFLRGVFCNGAIICFLKLVISFIWLLLRLVLRLFVVFLELQTKLVILSWLFSQYCQLVSTEPYSILEWICSHMFSDNKVDNWQIYVFCVKDVWLVS